MKKKQIDKGCHRLCHANALYLYCSGDVVPCGKDTLVVNKKLFDQKRIVKFQGMF